MRAAVSLLRSAKRPLLIIGKGAAYARAEVELQKLVESCGIPFLPTPMGKGVLPDSHPLCAGAARSLALAQCDVALVVGARLNWMLHFAEAPRWNPACKIIQIDINAEEISKSGSGVLPLVGSAPLVLQQVLTELQDSKLTCNEWVAALTSKCRANTSQVEQQLSTALLNADGVKQQLNYFSALKVIRDTLALIPGSILISEGANTMDQCRTVVPSFLPRSRLDAGSWGTMGLGVGYAIAGGLTAGEHGYVVAIEGDSAFGFSAMECEVICRFKLPCVIIVFNNGGIYGAPRTPEAQSGFQSDPAPTSFCESIRHLSFNWLS